MKKPLIGLHDIVRYAPDKVLYNFSTWNFMFNYVKLNGVIYSTRKRLFTGSGKK